MVHARMHPRSRFGARRVPRPRRRGVALLLTLVIVATTLAIAYVFSYVATTGTLQGASHARVAQAKAAAESGLEIALLKLNDDPDWAGESGTLGDPVLLTDTPELAYEVTVGPDPNDPWRLKVTSIGKVLEPARDGTPGLVVAAEHRLVAILRRERLACTRYVMSAIDVPPGTGEPGGIVGTEDVDFPEMPRSDEVYEVYGDVWANDDVLFYLIGSTVFGKAYANDWVTGSSYFSGGYELGRARLMRPPILAGRFYPTYKLGSVTQTAYQFTSNDVDGGTYPPTHVGNAAGVCYYPGNFTIKGTNTTVINGTLVVDGDLTIESKDTKIYARELDGTPYGYDVDGDGTADVVRFPAIVCTGKITIQKDKTRVIAHGSIHAVKGFIRKDDAKESFTELYGGIVALKIIIDDKEMSIIKVFSDASQGTEWMDTRAAPGFCRWVVDRIE